MAVFLTGNPDYVPTSLLHNLKHNKVLHERVLFVTVQNVDVPEVAQATGARGGRTGARHPPRDPALRLHGEPEHPARAGGAARAGRRRSTRCRPATSSAARCWCPATVPKLPWWRHWLFLVMARNAVPATEFFRIPSDRVVELGRPGRDLICPKPGRRLRCRV